MVNPATQASAAGPPSGPVSEIDAIFAPEGPLAAAIPGFRVRTQQVEMARRILETIRAQKILIAEAGTGTGKTFAYLVPALLSGGKVIVSTGTKTLQDQLFNKDLPQVRDALRAPVHMALLKGRANYLCHYHLKRALTEGRFRSREETGDLVKIQRFFKTTRTGDKAECGGVPENSPVWFAVTSTRDNCLGQECPDHKDCFVLAARREAMNADLVVVNHHLFFADVMLRDEGVAELLPACNTVIFDEAHQLPEVASLFFGESLSTSQIIDLVRDAMAEGLSDARDCLDLQARLPLLEKAARDLRLSVGTEAKRFSLAQLSARPEFFPALETLADALADVAEVLKTQAERSEGLERCWQRALELATRLEDWRKNARTGWVRWGESFSQSLQLNATPLSVTDIFRKQLGGHPRAWVFTSATLAVQGRFDHYQAELGLSDAETGYWESPFDYPVQAILYAPQGLPEPNAGDYADAVVRAALPVLDAARDGGAFFLCTSLKAMRRVHALLQEHLSESGVERPLFLQGAGSKRELLERFRQAGNGILIGSQSFWEGVDIRGGALSLVVIDKLPFAPPDDPVLAVRIEEMQKAGRNAFVEYQLPKAVINIKQGAGRLIRTETDRGVLMICDPRMLGKPYGRRVWRSLPPMKRTRDLKVVLDFFRSADNSTGIH
ncbi:MAG: ATP-dependent DNA helicase [Zoogloeaceae bacterium]|jgi:ATP-dependent DNA helicase DinG|nr:ATP-dependent DNA helicase [Zoogloeaceae bacterium]